MSAPEMELRRPSEEEPKTHGWYYGQAKDKPNSKPQPWLVLWHKNSLVVYLPGFQQWDYLRDFTWFGPVPKCVESST